VVVGIDVEVEEVRAGALGERSKASGVTALADVDDALEHPPSLAPPPRAVLRGGVAGTVTS
jgi:hypothetical protein